jgi:hemerythrin-like metal-binding protein
MSVYVAWKPFYSVNDPSLDAEHQRILELINKLHTAMNVGRERDVVDTVLDQLLQYTVDHFDHEERVMRDSAFPYLDSHKVLHDDMRRRTQAIHDDMSLVTAHDMLCFLKEWWIDHIQLADKEYSPYVMAQVC